jgi:hypothetical protein
VVAVVAATTDGQGGAALQELLPGVRVELHGLKSKDKNGLVGVCGQLLDNGRVEVIVDGTGDVAITLAIRPENIRHVLPGAHQSPAPAVTVATTATPVPTAAPSLPSPSHTTAVGGRSATPDQRKTAASATSCSDNATVDAAALNPHPEQSGATSSMDGPSAPLRVNLPADAGLVLEAPTRPPRRKRPGSIMRDVRHNICFAPSTGGTVCWCCVAMVTHMICTVHGALCWCCIGTAWVLC